ncbi:MAG TPA: ABC transporter permease, partial [Gemmatimonadaceae bacterium]|nr:ABC transporter permease [Gemmatimonadaceae bacterium]
MRLTLARAALIRHRARTLLAVLGVAVAAAMLLDMVMLATGMRESFRQLLLSRGFDIRLAPKGTLPFDTDATIPSVGAITSVLRSNPDIREISPVLGAAMHIQATGRDVSGSMLGIDPTVQGDYELLSGKDVTEPDAIVGNDHLLSQLHARIGDTLSVATGYDPQTRTYSGERKLVLTGRVRFIYGAAEQSSAAIRRETLEAMEGDARRDRASLFMIRVRPGADPDRVRDWIETYIPTVSAISIATAIAQVDQRLSYFRQ